MITKNKESKPFITADLNLASTLISLNYEILDLDKSNPKKIQFAFSRSPNLIQDINNYWGGSLRINPRMLFDSQKMLKCRLYSSE
jgi:hypothetical protein